MYCLQRLSISKAAAQSVNNLRTFGEYELKITHLRTFVLNFELNGNINNINQCIHELSFKRYSKILYTADYINCEEGPDTASTSNNEQ